MSRDSGLVVDKERFIQQRSHYNSKLTAAKQTYYNKTISEADPRERFKICNKLLNRGKKVVLPSHDCAKELADRFVNFFSDKISQIRDDLVNSKSSSKAPATEISFTGTPLEEFKPVSTEFVSKIIAASPSKSHPAVDPIPAWVLNECKQELTPVLTKICNLSLACADFSDSLKVAFVSPLIKKITLDCEILKNYRPVSNLSFVSKLIERIVCSQFIDHLKENGLHEIFQSAYKQFHSCETALTRVQSDILTAVDQNGGAILVLLDLSAAFDTIDHDRLVNLLDTGFGVRGSALDWIKSYLSNRKQSVLINGKTSEELNLEWGVPQGSVLGPLLFTIYTTPLAAIIRKHGLSFHLYADDTQLYLAFKPSSTLSQENSIKVLEACAEDIRLWMNENMLKLNDDKTELLIITSQEHLSKKLNLSINIGGFDIHPDYKEPPKNLGVLFDTTCGLKHHINEQCKSLNYTLYSLGKIRQYMDKSNAETLVNAVFTSKLDYCNSLFYGVNGYLLDNLQRCQNNAARIITRTRKNEHITPVLIDLHWLPVRHRIVYKINLLTYKSLNNLGPIYLKELLEYESTKDCNIVTRSRSDTTRLKEPRSYHPTSGDRTFRCAAPRLWNTLPRDLREEPDIDKFKSSLKTFLFHVAYG